MAHYTAARAQLLPLGLQAHSALVRMERELLLKVVTDFAEQLRPAQQAAASVAVRAD